MNAFKEILVIDDQLGYRSRIDNELKGAGYRTVLAQNSAEALVALLEKQDIEAVLLDVRLPVINGLNILEIIHKYFPQKKVIINNVLEKDEKGFFIYDADNYYEKSKNLSTLKEKIDNALSNNGRKVPVTKNDKRSSKRVPLNVFATCERGDQSASPVYAYFHSCTKDLSPSGGRFVVDEDIKVGQRFRVALNLPVNLVPFLIDCEVVWAKELEGQRSEVKEGAEIGVRFVKLDSPHDEEKLKQYLN
jgi:CheY-like chemotaxis protein